MRLLHTADWQLGLRLNFVGGDAAVRLRAARFDTVRRIGALAQARSVDAVLVAGDVFDDNGVGADTVQQARDALAAFGDIPLVLLPGNHDPATADSALRRLAPVPGNVRIAVERAPITLDDARGALDDARGALDDARGALDDARGALDDARDAAPALEIYPCPLLTRHHYDDPGAWLPARGASRAIRIALAHGGALAFGEPTETANHIDVAAILDRGFDYVALGDWHGVYQVSPRAWYPGAPEATRYKEKRPGYVLIVEIDGPGSEPRVEQVPIARSHWLSETVELTDDAALDGLAGWLEALDEKSWTLLELDLTGQLSLAGRARLDDLVAEYSDRLAHLRSDTSGVTTAPTAADLTTLHGEGFLGRAIDRLRAGDDPADADALRLLYRLMQETG